MKIITKSIIVIATITFLSSCGKETVYITQPAPTEPKVSNTVSKTYADTYTSSDPEEDFLDGIKTLNEGPVYVNDSDLLETGYVVCDALRSGLSANDAMTAIADTAEGDRSTYEFLSLITASAVTFLCPEQLYKFDAY